MATPNSIPAGTSASSTSALSILGFLSAATLLYKFVITAWLYTRRGNLSRYLHHHQHAASGQEQEPWALVTGASDGIGRAFAGALAEAGFNVVLHGRNPVKLTAVQTQLETQHPRRSFRMLVADASRVKCKNCFDEAEANPDDANKRSPGVDFGPLAASLHDLHLTVLINNVGGGPRDPSIAALQDHPAPHIAACVSLDALFGVYLTHALLPRLLARAPALVLNVGSGADVGAPFLSFYGGAKAFVAAFTRAVARECAVGGVEVLGVRVMNVTGVSWRGGEAQPPSVFMPSAEVFVRGALGKIGCGYHVVFGHWAHALQGVAAGLLPEAVVNWVLLRTAHDLKRVQDSTDEARKEM